MGRLSVARRIAGVAVASLAVLFIAASSLWALAGTRWGRERLARQLALGDRRRQGRHQRMCGGAGVRPPELLAEPVKRGEPIPGDLVAELVDEPREAVDREQVAPRARRQQP